jgi:type II secretory pathway pseudopilin PulG
MKPRRNQHLNKNAERGYILLILILAIALLTIAAAAIAPSIAFEVRRDREQELIHRGVQYSRAVQHYYKKFKRYPSKIEDLESTNNLRFLRKRYKDPITGKDFKLLHFGDAQSVLGMGAAGGLTQAANAGSAPGNQFGQPANGVGGGNPGATQPQADSAAPSAPTDSTTPAAGAAAGDSSNPSASNSTSQPSNPAQPGDPKNASTDKQTFGGGPIIGVTSTSKNESIREFNKKNHYNEWFFIYDPQSDRGGLLSTPYQPPLQGATPMAQPGGAGIPGAPGSGFGNQGPGNQGSPFGGGMQQPPQNPQPQPQQPQQ